MTTTNKSTVQNWVILTNPETLKSIHQKDVNIAIYERDSSALAEEVNKLLTQSIEFRSSGDVNTIIEDISMTIDSDQFRLIIQDIKDLLNIFSELTHAKSFRLLLATVNTNMCRKFHTDINDLRMLCTYSGPGTLWLTEDNINQKALESSGENDDIAIDVSKIQQAKTGAAIILKGAIYPKDGTRAIVHRSPTIEESGQSRLLLRIDTNDFLNFEL